MWIESLHARYMHFCTSIFLEIIFYNYHIQPSVTLIRYTLCTLNSHKSQWAISCDFTICGTKFYHSCKRVLLCHKNADLFTWSEATRFADTNPLKADGEDRPQGSTRAIHKHGSTRVRRSVLFAHNNLEEEADLNNSFVTRRYTKVCGAFSISSSTGT